MNGEYEFEPIPGLPEELPPGETLLWQGAPDWKIVATKVLHIRVVAVYFVALLIWYVIANLNAGESVFSVAVSSARLGALGLGAVALMGVYAFTSAKSTLYTVTSRRVVIRAGVALPMVLNLPFSKIESADVRTYANGGGDIALTLPFKERVAYLMLWPHAQPWRLARARPMLRGLPWVAPAAQILAGALAAAQPDAVQPIAQQDRQAARPSKGHRPSNATAMA